LKIAVHQMCSKPSFSDNQNIMAAAIEEAGKCGAKFYFAPEMSGLVNRDRQKAAMQIVPESNNIFLKSICAAAKQAEIWVHLGSLPVISDQNDRLFANRSIVIDSNGVVRARYDKMHLFDVELASGESWRESAAYEPGRDAVLVETPLGLMGLTICYDLRFPDLFSSLTQGGAQIIAVPAAFTVPTGQAHWHSLLRARAIESAVFIIAAAQSGAHEDGRNTYGHSLVIDPWGEILLDMGEGEGLAFVDIHLDRIDEVRRQIPVHLNRCNIPKPIKRF
jgi:deaminated glutathione amidase